jgi:ribosome-associated translation inhibitor RaiA
LLPTADEGTPQQGDWRPRPDPTNLTTQQLIREIAALKEVVFTRLDGMDRAIVVFNDAITRSPTDTDKQISHLKELHESRFSDQQKETNLMRQVIETRLNGTDNAIILLQGIAGKIPAQMDEKIKSLEKIHDEKFTTVQVQFHERDVRTEQSSKDGKVAIDAALQAAEKSVAKQNESFSLSVAKSEAATSKQIDQIMQLIQTSNAGMNDKFEDVKERLTRLEGSSAGRASSDTSHQTQSNWSTGIMVAIGLALLSAAITIGSHFGAAIK